jgi:molybdopterin-containing oxidoreductase family membrane subunit
MGRPWLAFWVLPYPNARGPLWVNFRSPLLWDVFAISAYATISAVFWFIGMIPDLAALRDRSTNKCAKLIYGLLAMGWRGSARHWKRYEVAYVLLAGLATPLVLSVHTVGSFDFTIGIIPGWHSTIFPPYFVAGAIFSGFAMVITIAIPLRAAFGLKDMITDRHLNNMAKVMLATGLMVLYGYLMEIFFSWYSGNVYEWYMTKNRAVGPYAPVYWLLYTCNALTPQFLWSRRIRRSPLALLIVSLIINVGMWCERFIIVVTSLHRDFLPSSWGMFYPTVWDWTMYAGSIGLFVFLLFPFVRFLPAISIAEMRLLVSGHHRKEGTLGGEEA